MLQNILVERRLIQDKAVLLRSLTLGANLITEKNSLRLQNRFFSSNFTAFKIILVNLDIFQHGKSDIRHKLELINVVGINIANT